MNLANQFFLKKLLLKKNNNLHFIFNILYFEKSVILSKYLSSSIPKFLKHKKKIEKSVFSFLDQE